MSTLKSLAASCIAVITLLAACDQAGPAERRVPKEYTPEQLRNNISLSGAGFNKDETAVLIESNVTGIFNVYSLSLSDTVSKALTKSTKESCFPIAFLPGTDKFLYSNDEGGNENYHIYLKSEGDSTGKDLTPWAGTTNQFVEWNADKTAMYISSNKRDVKFFDLLKIDTSNWVVSTHYQNDSSFIPAKVSRSGKYVALIKEVTTDKNELYLYNTESRNMTRISNDNEATWYPAAFEKNDSILYYATNDGNEFSYLVKFNINSGKSETLFQDKWDVFGMSLSENEKYHTVTINEDGKNKVLLFDHLTNKMVDFPKIPDGDVLYSIISPSEKNMLLAVGSSTSPANLFNYNFDSKELKQLTSALNKEVDKGDLVQAEVVRFKSFDGKEIPAIYYKPLQADKDHKVPALIWVHGGPGGQSRIGFSNTIQFLTNRGYAVLAVNNRGSWGYGKTFYKLDNRDHGNGDLKDCIWGKKWLTEQDYIDSSSIGIIGGSYGGNMVLNALCKHPDEFKLGVDIFGVANWLRTLKSVPPYWEAFRLALYDEMGDPNSADSVRLKEASPLFNYTKITKPLMVLQGANDVRVLKVESDEIVEGVKKNGVPVEYVVFPDEGHGFLKKENLLTQDHKIVAFLDQYLKPKSESPE